MINISFTNHLELTLWLKFNELVHQFKIRCGKILEEMISVYSSNSNSNVATFIQLVLDLEFELQESGITLCLWFPVMLIVSRHIILEETREFL